MAKMGRQMLRTLTGSALIGAMLVGAVPATAQRDRDRDDQRERHRGDGVDAGDVIAGAVIVGGLAAIIAAATRNNRDDTDHGPRARRAIEECVQAVEADASRYGDRADVTRIARVEHNRRGYVIRGTVVVQSRFDRYDRYDRYDRRYRPGEVDSDQGQFRCNYANGRVMGVRITGLR